jgi:hypothetical protein
MPGCGPPFEGLYRSPSIYPFCVGYLTFSATGGFVTQSMGRDGSIGKTLRKKTAALKIARADCVTLAKYLIMADNR